MIYQMTDKELEKEAEDYFCDGCENSFEHENGHCSHCSKWDYFIAGAKSREERIKELEKENAILKKALNLLFMVTEEAKELLNKEIEQMNTTRRILK